MTLQVDSLCPLLQVFDMSASVAFYRNVLGFEIVDHAPAGDEWDWVRLRLNGTDLMLNTAYESPHRPPSPDPRRVRGHADTVLFFGCPDVEEAYEHLRAHGLDVEAPSVAPYGMNQLNVTDPDGYQLCFQWPAG